MLQFTTDRLSTDYRAAVHKPKWFRKTLLRHWSLYLLIMTLYKFHYYLSLKIVYLTKKNKTLLVINGY